MPSRSTLTLTVNHPTARRNRRALVFRPSTAPFDVLLHVFHDVEPQRVTFFDPQPKVFCKEW